LEAKITAAIAIPTPTSPSVKPQLTDSKRKMDKNPTEKIRKSELIFLRHKLNRFKTNAHRTWPINLARKKKKKNNSTTDDPGTIFQCRQTFCYFWSRVPKRFTERKKKEEEKQTLSFCVCVCDCVLCLFDVRVCVWTVYVPCVWHSTTPIYYYHYYSLKNPSLHYNIPVCVWTRLRGEEDRGTLVAI
jgi:hypothetical protein